MEAAADLFVEESVFHRFQDIRIYADGKLPKITGSFVGIQQLVDPFGVVGGGLYNLAVFDFEADVFVGETLLFTGGVVGDIAVHGVLHRCRVYFAVRNVALAGTLDGRKSLDGEGQVGVRPNETHLVGPVHPVHQSIHGIAHLLVIQGAYVKIEVLKGFLALSGQLCHGGIRVS